MVVSNIGSGMEESLWWIEMARLIGAIVLDRVFRASNLPDVVLPRKVKLDSFIVGFIKK